MFADASRLSIAAILLVLTVLVILRKTSRIPRRIGSYIQYLWTFFLFFTIAEFVSFKIAIWILALLCFVALREYFTLVNIRLQDRWGLLGAHLSILFMIYFIQIERLPWFGVPDQRF